MHVGVDATCWSNQRGYGRHARALVGAMLRQDSVNRYTLFVDSQEMPGSLPRSTSVRVVPNSQPAALAASANGRRSPRDLWRMSRALSAGDCEVLLFPTVYSYVPVFGRARKVIFFHDVIAERYPKLTVPALSSRMLWKAKVALGRRQADAIVTVSEYSREGLVKYFGMPADRVFVIGEASDPVFRVLDQPQLSPRLRSLGVKPQAQKVVFVGGFGPHKNVKALIAAFGRIAANCDGPVQLVLVGECRREVFHSEADAIREQVSAAGLDDRVVFTGYLPDNELVILLNLATVLVLPSFMEGFGLPAVEAAACGCPVIATQESPLPRLLQGAALFFDPHDETALESALRRVLGSESLRLRLREAGIAAAQRLTWDAAARQMIAVLNEVSGL